MLENRVIADMVFQCLSGSSFARTMKRLVSGICEVANDGRDELTPELTEQDALTVLQGDAQSWKQSKRQRVSMQLLQYAPREALEKLVEFADFLEIAPGESDQQGQATFVTAPDAFIQFLRDLGHGEIIDEVLRIKELKENADDLSALRGSSRSVERFVNEQGFYTYEQIADWGETQVEMMMAKYGRECEDLVRTWIQQATKLAAQKKS